MPLTWALAVTTYRRADYLQRCVKMALAQTRRPSEIVISDASPDWEACRDAVVALVARHAAAPRCVYMQAARAQQTAQRNEVIAAARADILFMIDDDSLMYPACAAQVLEVYEADVAGVVAVVQPGLHPAPPDVGDASSAHAADAYSGGGKLAGLLNRAVKGRVFPRGAKLPAFPMPAGMRGCRVVTEGFQGARLTVRRPLAQALRFDENIVANVFEEYEACWRLGQRGLLLNLEQPLLYHAQATRAGDQSRRGFWIRAAWLLNHAYMIRKLFGDTPAARRHIRRYARRTVLLALATGLRARDLARYHGARFATAGVRRLLAAAAQNLGPILVEETQKARAAAEQYAARTREA